MQAHRLEELDTFCPCFQVGLTIQHLVQLTFCRVFFLNAEHLDRARGRLVLKRINGMTRLGLPGWRRVKLDRHLGNYALVLAVC